MNLSNDTLSGSIAIIIMKMFLSFSNIYYIIFIIGWVTVNSIIYLKEDKSNG
jgi:hypothetical protein